MFKFIDLGYKFVLWIYFYDIDCYFCNMYYKWYFLFSGDYGEFFSVYGSFEEVKFVDGF